MIYAGILAGGTGSRMGSDIPKQFLPVAGRPIIIHTIEKFLSCPRFDHVYVAVVNEYLDYMNAIIEEHLKPEGRLTVIVGGSDRSGSLLRVIEEIRKNDNDPDSILVSHDGVRPFVTTDIIGRNIDAALEYGAAGTAVPTTDTILCSADGTKLDSIPDRSALFNAQTPQSFRIGWFEHDYGMLSEQQKESLTDACKIFVLSGREVRIVAGDAGNIKITTPFDMQLADAILARADKE